jgi:uncharacterized membrane protein
MPYARAEDMQGWIEAQCVASSLRCSLEYVVGSLGTLIGADLLNLGGMPILLASERIGSSGAVVTCR